MSDLKIEVEFPDRMDSSIIYTPNNNEDLSFEVAVPNLSIVNYSLNSGGSNDFISMEPSVYIPAYSLVSLSINGLVLTDISNINSINVIGITINSASPGGFSIIQTSGKIQNSNWYFDLSKSALFAWLSGGISQVINYDYSFTTFIGELVSSYSFIIKIQPSRLIIK